MPCYKPTIASRLPDGNISFKYQDTLTHENLQFPCGQCVGCRLDKARDTAIRCMHEASQYDANSFLTLTYSPEKLSSPSLIRDDIDLFCKRLRKHAKKKISIFGCGEYGSLLSRPHFHLCVFDFDFSDKKFLKRTDQNDSLFTSTKLENLWQHGFSTIGDLSFASACYVARYCTKKVNGKHADEYYSGRSPEFAIYPRRPALGRNWIEKNIDMVSSNNYILQQGGIKTPVPRYYLKQIEKLNPEKYLQMKVDRENFIRDNKSIHRDYAALKIQIAKHEQIHRGIEDDISSRPDDYDLKLLEQLKYDRDNYVAYNRRNL